MTEEELSINGDKVASYISKHPGVTAQEIADKISSTPNDINDVNMVLEYLFNKDQIVKYSNGGGPTKYSLSIYAKKVKPASERVNHPQHYTHPSGVECIEVVRHMNFNLGNAIKYIWRCGSKEGVTDIEDLKKALWYINDEIKRRETE